MVVAVYTSMGGKEMNVKHKQDQLRERERERSRTQNVG